MKNKTISITFLLLLAVGCTPTLTPSPDASLPATQYTPSGIPSATPSETETPVSTPSATPGGAVVQRCLDVSTDEIPMAGVATGSILIRRYLNSSTYYLHDLQSGIEYQLPTQTKLSVQERAVSPDRNMLAYIEYDDYVRDLGFTKMILWVVNAQAAVLAKITYDHGDLNSMRWVSNEQLLFENYLTTQEGTVLMVNPFTNEQHLLRNEMPGYFAGEVLTGLTWRVEYSPDLEWGMYVEGQFPYTPSKAILRDFVSGATIWQSQNSLGDLNKPLWSSDGKVVAYQDGDELYLLERSGEATLLSSEASGQGDDYRWSPDGHYLAFWGKDSLMLYDRQVDVVTELCYLDDAIYHYLIWSPDSKQIDINLAYSGYEKNMVVDITSNTARPLASTQDQYYGPDIWMSSIP